MHENELTWKAVQAFVGTIVGTRNVLRLSGATKGHDCYERYHKQGAESVHGRYGGLAREGASYSSRLANAFLYGPRPSMAENSSIHSPAVSL